MVLDFDNVSSLALHGSCEAQSFGSEARPVTLPAAAAVPHMAAGRYGESGRSRWPAIVLAVGIHLALAPALLSLGYQAVKRHEASLTAINLSPPPPPPASPPAEPKAQTLQTAVQPVPVTTAVPIPRPVIAMVPTAVPQVPMASVAAPKAAVAAPAPTPPAPPSTVTSDALGTRMISGSPPRYPVESRRKKEQGTVELLLVLGTDGRVETITVTRSSGFDRLDDAALSAVRRWRWAPTLRDGAAVKVRGIVEIPFMLTTA